MKNKSILYALMAFSLVALATGCTKEDEENFEQNEVVINLLEVGDNDAVIHCAYNPGKSKMYQLSLGESTYLNNWTKSGTMRIENLQSGKDYKVVARSYDANCNLISSSEVSFKTTGVIMDRGWSLGVSVWNEEEYNNCPIKVSITKMTENSAKVTCEFTASDIASSYSLGCVNYFYGITEGTFNETGTFGEGKKEFTLTGLRSGLDGHYTLFAYYHGLDGKRTGKYASFDFSICF